MDGSGREGSDVLVPGSQQRLGWGAPGTKGREQTLAAGAVDQRVRVFSHEPNLLSQLPQEKVAGGYPEA